MQALPAQVQLPAACAIAAARARWRCHLAAAAARRPLLPPPRLLFPRPKQKLAKEKEALQGEVARLERELQQERSERKAAVAAALAAAQDKARARAAGCLQCGRGDQQEVVLLLARCRRAAAGPASFCYGGLAAVPVHSRFANQPAWLPASLPMVFV